MGCGCKGKKKKTATVSASIPANEQDAKERKKMIKDQRAYQDKVKDALRQLTELRRRKARHQKK